MATVVARGCNDTLGLGIIDRCLHKLCVGHEARHTSIVNARFEHASCNDERTPACAGRDRGIARRPVQGRAAADGRAELATSRFPRPEDLERAKTLVDDPDPGVRREAARTVRILQPILDRAQKARQGR